MYNVARIYGCQTGRAPGMASLETQAAMVIMALHYSGRVGKSGQEDRKVKYVRKISKMAQDTQMVNIYA